MTLRSAIRVVVILTLLGESAEAQRPEAKPPREQTAFAMEGVPISNPIDLPDSAVQVFRKNKFILSCLEDGQKPEDIPASWFVASEIHLGGVKEIDLVVQPRDLPGSPSDNRCLWHAHSIPFWVLQKTPGAYALVMEDNAQVWRVLNSRSKGYRDVETFMSTTLGRTKTLFKWDGHQYKIQQRTTNRPQ